MQPHFLHVRSSPEHASAEVESWYGRSLPLESEAVEEDNGWVTLSLDLDTQPSSEWLRLGRSMDVFYESYSTSLCCGELVYVAGSALVRHLRRWESDSELNVDEGLLRFETNARMTSWVDIWSFVDDLSWEAEVRATGLVENDGVA